MTSADVIRSLHGLRAIAHSVGAGQLNPIPTQPTAAVRGFLFVL